MEEFQLVIGGKHTAAMDGSTFTVDEPATGKPLAEVARAGPEDARRAVDAAHRAFTEGPWPRTPGTQRGKVLLKVASLVRERLEDLAATEGPATPASPSTTRAARSAR